MKASTKIQLSIIILGILYCIYSIVNDHGGSSLEDVWVGIVYTSILIFITALITIIIKRRNLKDHLDAFIFLLLGLPLTIGAIIGSAENIYENRQPDLTIKYPRPVTKNVFFKDSLNTELAIDSFVALRNRLHGGPNIKYGILDTIIYSPSGNEIFIIYANKYELNDLGNDFDPDYFSATKRGDNKEWELETRLQNKTHWGGSYHSMKELKESVRKFYFNEYKFKPTDSLEDNYFWKTKNNR
jgi:hypothetical protein